MIRRVFALLAPVLLLGLFAACGGDDTADKTPAAGHESTPGRTDDGQPNVNVPFPSPTPVGDTDTALVVTADDHHYQPLLQDFKALPHADVDAGGKKVNGVTIGTLASQVSGTEKKFVTITGLQADGSRVGSVRFPLGDVATNTVLTVGNDGHMALVSATIPQPQWLVAVTSVTFQ